MDPIDTPPQPETPSFPQGEQPSSVLGGDVKNTTEFMAKNWRDLIRPRVLEIEEKAETYGKFSCEPLERGFGRTLGNSLRRVLLSSLQGAAITHVKIEGALHEFTSLPNVVEDITDIILNFKEVMLKVDVDRPYTLRLNQEGDREVKARDIETVTGVTILNPDHHIATLSAAGRAQVRTHRGHWAGLRARRSARTKRVWT